MPSHPPETPAVSLVVPTFNEADNIGALLAGVQAAVPPDLALEVLFVDDSTDHTPAVIERMAADRPFPVAVHHRTVPEGGLSGAVVEGIALTSAPWIVVIDADLQHPPALISALIARGESADAELVVATRYALGGGRDGLSGPHRVLASRTTTLLSKALFPWALRGVTDPMSGCFAIRRAALARAAAAPQRPDGYKILLELAVRCRPLRIAEVPYAFGERHAGRSKSGLREGLRFLRRVIELRTGTAFSRATAVGLIGLSGFAPNLSALWLLHHIAGLPYAPAEIIANQFGVLWNYLLLDSFVYHRRVRTPGRLIRLAGFAAFANADLLIRIPLAALIMDQGGLAPLPATAVAIGAVFALRFLWVDNALYRRIPSMRSLLPLSAPNQKVPEPEPLPGSGGPQRGQGA